MRSVVHTLILIAVLLKGAAHADTLFYRTWNFSSAPVVTFSVPDTVTIKITFPNTIPPDYLLNYTVFSALITDSNPSVIQGSRFISRIIFDAGFLYFDHEITCDINIAMLTGIIPDFQRCRFWQDPAPVTGLHQWYPFHSYRTDSVSLAGFVYTHIKYVQHGNAKRMIASTGYPFEFGLFESKTSSAGKPARFINVSSPGDTRRDIYLLNGIKTPVDSRCGNILVFRSAETSRTWVSGIKR